MPCIILEAKFFNAILQGLKTVEGRPRNGKFGHKIKNYGQITAGDIAELRLGQGCARQDNYHLFAGTALYVRILEVRLRDKPFGDSSLTPRLVVQD